MSTEEYNQGIADEEPVEIVRNTRVIKKRPQPQMIDRETFYKWIGFKDESEPSEIELVHENLPTEEFDEDKADT